MGIENPRKTRQSVFLEQQTKAGIDKEGIYCRLKDLGD